MWYKDIKRAEYIVIYKIIKIHIIIIKYRAKDKY